MKTFSKVLVTSLLLSGSTLIHAAGAQGQGSGQVKFHGYIVNAPCSIVSDDPIAVEFGQISNKLLNSNNVTGESHIKSFNIELADCDVSDLEDGTVTTTFTFTAASTANAVVQNYVGLDSLPDSGAGIVMVAGNEQVKNGEPLKPRSIQTGPNTLEFTSFVKGLGGNPVKTGEFYANANFTLDYQ